MTKISKYYQNKYGLQETTPAAASASPDNGEVKLSKYYQRKMGLLGPTEETENRDWAEERLQQPTIKQPSFTWDVPTDPLTRHERQNAVSLGEFYQNPELRKKYGNNYDNYLNDNRRSFDSPAEYEETVARAQQYNSQLDLKNSQSKVEEAQRAGEEMATEAQRLERSAANLQGLLARYQQTGSVVDGQSYLLAVETHNQAVAAYNEKYKAYEKQWTDAQKGYESARQKAVKDETAYVRAYDRLRKEQEAEATRTANHPQNKSYEELQQMIDDIDQQITDLTVSGSQNTEWDFFLPQNQNQDQIDKLRQEKAELSVYLYRAKTREWEIEQEQAILSHGGTDLMAALTKYAQLKTQKDQAQLLQNADTPLKTNFYLDRQLAEADEQLRSYGMTDEQLGQWKAYAERMYNAEGAEKTEAMMRDQAQSGLGGALAASAMSVLLGETSFIGLVNILGQTLQREITGSDIPVDYNNWTTYGAKASQAATGGVAEKIAEKTAGKIGSETAFGNLYSNSYQLAMSMVNSLASGGATILLGGSAAISGIEEALEQGANQWQALGVGLLYGAAEMVFEKVSLDRLFDTQSPKGWKDAILNILKQGGVEASEETFTTIANTLGDMIIMGDKSQLKTQVRTLMGQGMSKAEAEKAALLSWGVGLVGDAIGGAVSGGLFGAGGNLVTADYTRKKTDNNETAKPDNEIVKPDNAIAKPDNAIAKADNTQAVGEMAKKEDAAPFETGADVIGEPGGVTSEASVNENVDGVNTDVDTIDEGIQWAGNMPQTIEERTAANEQAEQRTEVGQRRNEQRAAESDGRYAEQLPRRRYARSTQQRADEARRIQSNVNALGRRLTSLQEQGLFRGTADRDLLIADREAWTPEVEEAWEIAQSEGLEAVFLLGNMKAVANNGTAVPIAAAIENGKIYARADSLKQSVAEAVKHEVFHEKCRKDPKLVERVKKRIQETHTREETAEMFERYTRLYQAEFANLTDKQLVKAVWEEMLADAYAEMQRFSDTYGTREWNVPTVEETWRGTGGLKNGDEETRFSVETLPDGKKYVKADRQVITGSDPKAWSEQLEDYINGKIRRGQNVQLVAEDGEVLTLTSRTAGKVASMFNNNGTTMSEKAFERKVNAGAHIDELAQVSVKTSKTVKDYDGKHVNEAAGGWNYRTAFFRDFDGKYYKCTISVQIGTDGNAVYNIGRMEERSFPQISSSSANRGAEKEKASFEDIVFNEDQNVNTKFSVAGDGEMWDTEEVDSDGKQLTREQQEFFKHSKVRNENGNLKVMYHGTSRGGFNIFDPYGKSNYGLFGAGSYFTDNKDIANSYTNKGRGQNKQVYETYLNITNPIDMDAPADAEAWTKALPEADFPASGTNEDFYRAMERYFEDMEYAKWEATEGAIEILESMGFDGITHIGGGRVNADGVRHQVYIAFQPEQIKRVDNLKPTDRADIRYSMSGSGERDAADIKAELAELIKPGLTGGPHAVPRVEAEVAGHIVRPEGMSDEQYADLDARWQERHKAARGSGEVTPIEELIIPKASFTSTPAMDKLGIKIEGSVTRYRQTEQLRAYETAARKAQRVLKDRIRALKPTEAEKELANGLVNGHITVAMLDDDAVNINTITELADYMMAARSFSEDMIAERRSEINTANYRIAETMFKDSDAYNPKLKIAGLTKIVMNERTPERVVKQIFGQEQGSKIYETYFRPVWVNGAEMNRFENRMLDRVAKFEDSSGTKRAMTEAERAIAQRLMEGEAARDNVMRLGQDMRERVTSVAQNVNNGADFADEVREFGLDGEQNQYYRGLAQAYADYLDTVTVSEDMDQTILKNAIVTYQQIYNEMYDAINDFLVSHGYKEIGFIKGYAPHFQKREVQQGLFGALKTLGVEKEGVSELPASIAGRTADFKPNMKWNPHMQSRQGSSTSYDILKGFEQYLHYAAEMFYHTDDVMRVRQAVNWFRGEYAGETISQAIEDAQVDRYKSVEWKKEFLEKMDQIDPASRYDSRAINTLYDKYVSDLFEKASPENLQKYSEFVTWLDNYANIVAGKQSLADRGLEYGGGRNALNMGSKLMRRFSAANVAGNLSSVLNQSAQLPLIQQQLGTYLERAIWDMARGGIAKDNFVERSDFLTDKRGVDKLTIDNGEKFITALFKPAELMDRLVSTVAVRGRYLQALSEGMTMEQAIKEADDFGRRVMGSRMKGAKPLGFESKTFVNQMLHVFQVEASNTFDYMLLSDMPQAVRETAKTKGKAAAARQVAGFVVGYLLNAFLLNRLTDELYGGSPAPFDLMGWALNFAASGFGRTDEDFMKMLIDNAWERLFGERPFETERLRDENGGIEWAGNTAFDDLWYNALNDVPYVRNAMGLLGLGDQTLPTVGVNEFIENVGGAGKTLWDQVWKGEEETGISWAGAARSAGEDLLTAATQIMPGGRQIKKSVQGALAVGMGGKYSGDRMQYPVAQNVLNAMQAILFGPSALSETDAYYAEGLSGLTAGQTEKVKELEKLGVHRMMTYNLYQEFREINKELTGAEASTAKRNAINNLYLDDQQKLDVYAAFVMDQASENYQKNREQFQAMLDAGLTWDDVTQAHNVYAMLNEDEEMNGTAKATEFAKWVDQQGWDNQQRTAVEEKFKFWMQMPAQAANYEKFETAGVAPERAADLANVLAELQPEDGKETVSLSQKVMAIDGSKMSDEEKVSAIAALVPDKRERLVEAGVSDRNARDMAAQLALAEAENGEEELSYLEKAKILAFQSTSDQETLAAVSTVLPESTYKKVEIADRNGVPVEYWIRYRDEWEATYGDANVSQEKVQKVLDGMVLTDDEKAVLWQLANKSWKPKNNPYNSGIGEDIYWLLNEE